MRNNHMVGTRTEDNKSIQHFNSNTDTRALLLLVLHGDGDGLDVSTHCNLFLLLIIDKNVRFIILMLELFIMLLMLCCFLWSTIRYFFNSVANWTLAIVFVNPNIFSIVDCTGTFVRPKLYQEYCSLRLPQQFEAPSWMAFMHAKTPTNQCNLIYPWRPRTTTPPPSCFKLFKPHLLWPIKTYIEHHLQPPFHYCTLFITTPPPKPPLLLPFNF